MKRVRQPDCFKPNKRQTLFRPVLKRRREGDVSSNKRLRTDESDALQRMLVEAYARIEQLEQQLKEAKFLHEYILSQNSRPTYNHGILCH